MSEFSQLVRARLSAQQAPSEHLDPDVLAAFGEHRLGERERIGVVAHLASCANCREVVAMASQMQPDLQVATTPARSLPMLRRRLSIGRLGMIGALAVLAVGATVLLRVDQSRRTVASAKLRIEEPAAAPPSFTDGDRKEQNQSASKLAPSATEKKSEPRAHQGQSAHGQSFAAVPKTLTLDGGPTQANGAVADRMSLPRPTVAPPEAALSTEYARTAPPPPPPTVADKSRAMNQQSFQLPQPPPSEPQQQPSSQVAAANETVEVQAAPALQQNARGKREGQSAQNMDANLHQVQVLNGTVSAPWSITADGKLQRATGTGPEGPQWQLVPVDANVVFRVVNATGHDVWAGGNGGALFHSTDGGDHWSRIWPQSSDRKLEGDVLSIRVAGGTNQIVRLRTSADQSWISSDGGATWKVESR